MTAHSHLHATRPDIAAAVARPPDAEVVSVIAVQFRRGEGCCDEDPVRLVTAYYSMDGELLAENDPSSRGDRG